MGRLRILAALIVLALVYLAVDRRSGLSTWMRQRADLASSDEKIAALERENERLRREIERLERDPFAIERAIREDLEFARAGETVIRIPASRRTNPRIP